MKKKYTLQFVRKRKKITNYRRRLKLVMSGKPRLVIRKSLKYIMAQIANYSQNGDLITVSATSKQLKKYGWPYSGKNVCAAYLTGLLLGKKMKSKKSDDVIVDIGLNPSVKGSRIYALLKGIKDAGINVPASEEIFPSQDRILGKHIVDYAEKLGKSDDVQHKQFSAYVKNKTDPKEITRHVESVKKRILQNGKEER